MMLIKGVETLKESLQELIYNSPLNNVDLMVTGPTGARILSPSSLG